MIKNQTKYEIADMTKSENVKKSSSSVPPCPRKQGKKTSGVATQKRSEKELLEKKIKDDLKKSKVLVNVLYDVLTIYGYKNFSDVDSEKNKKIKLKTKEDKQRLLTRIFEFCKSKPGFGNWKDFFKYKINAFFSYVMKQEIPPMPSGLENFPDLANPSFLFYGRAKRYLSRLSLNRDKLESFAQSVAQSKKGAPPVLPDQVREAEIKCFEHLTTKRDDLPSFSIFDGIFEHQINRDTMKYQLRRTVREIFRGRAPAWTELTKPFVPSTSSQYNFSRSGLGGVGAFLGNETIDLIRRNNWGFEGEKKTTFVSKALGPVQLKNELTELYGKAGIEDQRRIDHDFENVMVKGTIGLHFDGKELTELWKNVVYPTMIAEALEERPDTIVIGLPEPLKVRCITAGPPLTYAVLKPMQKWLWRNLKDHDVFQLIGTPVTCDIVKQQLGQLLHNEEFVSGDYKASTDNLHSWVSESLLESFEEIWQELKESGNDKDEFLTNYLEDFVTLMKRALTGHNILNPLLNDEYKKSGSSKINVNDFKKQQEGQLMGSIISFPFLCLANAAMCRWAMEITDCKNYSLKNKLSEGYSKCRLLVNGDDCVFPGKIDELFVNWERITAFGGLESSVGKTFKSTEFMTINSVQYKYSDIRSGWEDDVSSLETDYKYQDIKYVNLGLVYGQKKDGIRGKPFYRLGAVHRDLFKTCPPEYFERASELFMKNAKKIKYKIKYNPETKEVYKEEDFFGCILNAHVPYYMPEWLGGLGLVKTKKDQINDWDLKVAATIRANQSDFKIKNIKDETLWQFHRLVDKSLEDYAFLKNQNYKNVEYLGTERCLSEEYQKLYTLEVVNILLTTSPFALTHSGLDLDYDQLQRENHFNNVRIWRNLRNNVNLGGLVASQKIPDFDDLLAERKEFPLSCFDVRI